MRFVKEEHIDMYIQDSMDLVEQIKNDENVELNVYILNSLVLLYANALRVDDLDANVLPLFTKHKIKHDVYTY